MGLVDMNENEIQKELSRFKQISGYGRKIIVEQAPPKPPTTGMPPPPPAGAPGAAPMPAGVPGAAPGDTLPPPPEEGDLSGGGGGAPPPAGPETAPMPSDEGGGEAAEPDTKADDTTEEIDITDLVNMTKSIKKQLDDQPKGDPAATQKIDDVFNKLNDLEAKLGEMDTVISKIDELEAEVEKSRPKTPVEQLELRSLDSEPFDKKPDEFFAEKQKEMEASGKNEYVLTKGDVENYSKNQIMKSFNPDLPNNQY